MTGAVRGIGGFVGGMIQAEGEEMEGRAREAAARQNAAIAGYNRDVALRNAGVVRAQGYADVNDRIRDASRTLSTIRAAYGASGFAITGSPTDVLEDQISSEGHEAAKVKYKADVQSATYEDEAANYGMRQNLYNQEAEFAPRIASIRANASRVRGAFSLAEGLANPLGTSGGSSVLSFFGG